MSNRVRPAHLRASAALVLSIAGILVMAFLLLHAGATALARSERFTPNASVYTSTYTVCLPVVLNNYDPYTPLFGVQTYGAIDASTGLSRAVEVGTRWLRVPIAWRVVEPVSTTPPAYHWEAYDASIANARAAGMGLVVTVEAAPSWAATYTNGPIKADALGRFAMFVQALVEHYNGYGVQGTRGSPVVEYLELYNEPDGDGSVTANDWQSYWGPFGGEYAGMLAAVYPAVKAASPSTQVVLGGVALDSFEDQGGSFVRSFLDDVFRAGGGAYFDVLAFHYYPLFAPNWNTYGVGLTGKANYLWQKLAQYGLNKRMISTEAGWHSNSDPYPPLNSTPEEQARYVIRLNMESMAAQLDVMIWWTLVDPGPVSGANGLVTRDLSLKPAYTSYRTMTNVLEHARYQRAVTQAESGSPSVEGYVFKSYAGRTLYVLWYNGAGTQLLDIPGSQVQVTSMMGSATTVNDGDFGDLDHAVNNRIRLSVGVDPIYVEVIR